MYTDVNFKTKKALKAAVQAYNEYVKNPDAYRATVLQGGATAIVPPPVTCYSPGPFPCPRDGSASLEGPHYPKPHTWYASVILKNGIVVSVK